jgi:hypothetical protein
LLLAALPSAAQAQGVTVLRGESGEQQRPGVPDTGVRRVPSTSHPAPAPVSPPAPSSGGQLPLGNGNGVVPADPPSEVAKEIAAGKPLSPGEAAALAAAFKAIDDGRYADARAAVASFNNPLLKRIVDWHVLRVAPKTDAEIRTVNAMVRMVAAEFPELSGVNLAVIYGDRGMPGIGSYDWVGFDKYDEHEAIFCDGRYDDLKAELRADQRIILVPGGASPWKQDPAPFYNKAVSDTQVLAIVPFIWQDNAAPGVGAGIRSNSTKPRYIQAGTLIKNG